MKTYLDYNFPTLLFHYFEAVFFTEADNEDVRHDDTISSFAPEHQIMALDEICSFVKENIEFINDDVTEEQLAHDIWLTRNHHGVGFWDRPEIYGDDNAKALTEASHKLGTKDVYRGNDNQLYFF